jgi:hypothetical protein
MSFKKGNKISTGRVKGTCNKSTAEFRDIFKLLLEANLPKVQAKLNRVAEEQPAKYIDLILKISSFCIPTLNSVQEIQVLPSQEYRVSFDMPKDN